MEDFLTFRKMITPVVLQVLFWLGEIANLVLWISIMNRGNSVSTEYGTFHQGTSGILVLVCLLGLAVTAILIRVYLEIIIVVFRINENVVSIRGYTDTQGAGLMPSNRGLLPNAGIAQGTSATAYCPQCGSPAGGGKFCTECGNDLGSPRG